ncbi:MAG: DUF1499 domain-containing protein [Deltaproteobacteria bacterium]|nr:DUF1499 domain-containing protein [Deltaproteobacteria bacterium]
MSFLSCAGTRPTNLGVETGRLTACPSSPNCVCSDDRDAGHGIEPFRLAVGSEAGWIAARDAVAAMPRTTIVTERPGYLHAESRSAFFGFVDDLELCLRRDHGVIAVRSASRLGYGDLGVNRKRVESLRETLRSRGVVAP